MRYQKTSSVHQQIKEKKREILKYLKDNPDNIEVYGRYKDKKAEKLSFELLALLNRL
jgi:hypothetical protein